MAVVEKRAYVAIVEKRILISREENKREREKGKGVIRVGGTMTWPSRENAHTMDRCTLQAIALADSPSYGNIPRYLWWQASCPEVLSTSR